MTNIKYFLVRITWERFRLLIFNLKLKYHETIISANISSLYGVFIKVYSELRIKLLMFNLIYNNYMNNRLIFQTLFFIYLINTIVN